MDRLCPSCLRQVAAEAPLCPHCGADVESPPERDPFLGRVIANKFRLLSILGEGGMGRAYKAEQQPLGVEVCVKTLHPQLTRDRTVVKRFYREALAASRLRHPNCVAIYDFGEFEGTFFIAMEFLRGLSLHDLVAREPRLDLARVARIVAQVLDVLEAAHRLQIIHRDLKPANVMIEDLPTHRDFVKVLDFGVAKLSDPVAAEMRLTQTGTIFGTPAYMAPEQAQGREIDGRADLYSVGVMLYELTTGRAPFDAPGWAALLARRVAEPAPPVRASRPDLPLALASLIDAALARDPDARPPTALAFKQALEESLADKTSPPTAMRAVDIVCPRCGAPNPGGSRFCGSCGAATAGGERPADLRNILPAQILDEVARVRAQVAGEKREVVVLCADLGGAALQADPETAAAALAALTTSAAEVALRHGGSIDATAGPELVVTFGVPVAHADDAERAARCALALRTLVNERNAAVTVSMGIHAGQAVIGDTSPVGDAIDLARRLAHAAAPGQIVASEKVSKLARAGIALRRLPAIIIKGRAAAVTAYEVTGTRTPAPAAHLATPGLCGRRAELDAALRTTADARAGRLVVVSGEAGSGKTRFLEELGKAFGERGVPAIVTSALPADDGTSPAVRDLLRWLAGGADVARALGLPDADAGWLLPFVGAGERPTFLGEVDSRAAIVAALARVVERAAARGPLAILVDDAHLADPLTGAFCARLVAAPIAGLMVVLAARSGHGVPWGDAPSPLVLGPLGDAAIQALVAGALAPVPPPPGAIEAVTARAGGSPRLALELLRSLIDERLLVWAGGAWTLVGDPASLPVPEGLHGLLAARIDALPADARLVLSICAVMGDELSWDVVEGVAAADAAVAGAREELEARGFVAAGRFTSPLFREIAYGRLVQSARQRLHRRVGEMLEASGRASADVLGTHFYLGDDAARALPHLGRAAEAARAAGETARAARALRRAVDIGRRAAAPRLARDCLALGELLLDLGELDEAATALDQGLEASRRDGDPGLATELRRASARVRLARGDLEPAARELDAAMQEALGQRRRDLITELSADTGELHERRGDLMRAADYFLRALELAQSSDEKAARKTALRCLNALGRLYLRFRNPDKAGLFLDQALKMAEELDDRLAIERVLGNLGAAWHARGMTDAAVRSVERALALAQELGDQIGIARQHHNLGTIHLAAGASIRAEASFDAAYAAARQAGWREGMAAAAASLDRLRRGSP